MKKFTITILAIASVFCVYKLSQKTELEKARQKHMAFYNNHPYLKNSYLSKSERKAQGLPPNAYFEQKYLSQINPYTGEASTQQLFKLQEEINKQRALQKVPGDNGNEWIERGPNNVGGRTRVVLFDPNDYSGETVFAGGVSGGLWKNTKISSKNSKWERVGIPENLAISCLAVDPNNSKVFYVGTGESFVDGRVTGNGLWKSTDGGNSWKKVFGGATGSSFFNSNAKLEVSSPYNLKGEYIAIKTTAFGGYINSPISGSLVLVKDGEEPITDGCQDFTNGYELNGKVALIQRGDCSFSSKVKKAQDAGAKAVVIYNNKPGAPINMAGDDASIRIPAVMISNKDGAKFIDALKVGTVEINLLNNETDLVSGNIAPGVLHINDVIVRNNSGISEVYVAVGDAIHRPSSPSTLIGADALGVYKSTDGNTFNKIDLPKTEEGNLYEPNNLELGADNSIYLSTTSSSSFYNGGGVIFKSEDGNNFSIKRKIKGGRRTEIAVSTKTPGLVYIVAQHSEVPVKIYKTTNDFLTLQDLPLPKDVARDVPANDFTRGQAFYDLLLKVDPNDENTVYIGGIDLFKSTNGGTTWNQISKWNATIRGSMSVVHSDQHGMAFSENSSQKVLFSNDGGVYYSDNAGTTIKSRNYGYNVTQFYSLGVAPTTAFPGQGDYFVAGAQDNGTQSIEDASTFHPAPAKEVQGGDGAFSFFDTDGKDRYQIFNYVYNNKITMYDYDKSLKISINSERGSNGDFINQEALDSNLDILYSNYSNKEGAAIMRYSNLKGYTIKKDVLTNKLFDVKPSALTVSPHSDYKSQLYVGLISGKLLKVSNANSTPSWKDISGDEFLGSISDIELGQTENEIFVTMNNYGVKSIWYSKDGGYSWVNKEGNLPDLPVNSILQNPLNTNEVIIGTDLGVWKTINFKAENPQWVQSYNGMSNVIVTDLDLRNDNSVFAATYGRGVFSGKFTSESSASVENVVKNTDKFTVFPTISSGEFTLYAKNNLGKVTAEIYNLGGQKVYTTNLDFTLTEKQSITVNLATGVYIVRVLGNNVKSSKKIVIK